MAEKGTTDGITVSTDMNLSKLWEIVKDREAWSTAVHGHKELDMIEPLNNDTAFVGFSADASGKEST